MPMPADDPPPEPSRPHDAQAPGDAADAGDAAGTKYRDLPAEEGAEQVSRRPVPRGRNLIVAIGIDKYEHWPPLDNAVSDAQGAVAAFCELGFELFAPPLLDESATRAAIDDLTEELGKLERQDSLIVFFAGHGHTVHRVVGEKKIKNGYLIPVGGALPGGKTKSWVNLAEWIEQVCQLPAHHILVILDACRSGIALETTKYRGEDGEDRSHDNLRSLISRKVITSAHGDQQAKDSGPMSKHSLFTGYLIQGLTQDLVPQRYVTGSDLGVHLRKRVLDYSKGAQTPDFGGLNHDERGELVLQLAADPPRPAAGDPSRSGKIVDELDVLTYLAQDHARAERIILRTLELQRQGEARPEYASLLTSLGDSYPPPGTDAGVEPLLEQARRMYNEAVGPGRSGATIPPARLQRVDTAADLDREALRHQVRGEFAKAERLFKRALDLRKDQPGDQDPEVASSLLNLAALYQAQGANVHARDLLEQALAVTEQARGPDHPDVAIVLNRLAEAQDVYGKARQLYERALRILENAHGADHPDVATALNDLAALDQAQGANVAAQKLYERALQIRENALSPEHPDVAIARLNLAAVYEAQGAYDRAEALYQRVLEVREREGSDDLEVAALLRRVAAVCWKQGAYDRAEALYGRALQIRERLLAPEHPDIASVQHDLAQVYEARGAYAQAEPLYERALQIFETVLGPEHPTVLRTINDLAGVYRLQGANDRAARLYERAHQIGRHALGQHLEAARSQLALAEIHQARGDYDRAAPLYETGVDILEQALGAEHPEVADALADLAGLRRAQGNLGEAEALYARALGIRDMALGANHPSVATALHNLAWLFQARGDHARAEQYYQRALEISERSLGMEHPTVATLLNNLAVLCWSTGDIARAAGYFARAAELRESRLDIALASLSEPRKRQFLQTQRSDTEAVVSFHLHAAASDPDALALALTVALRRKGRVLDEVTRAQATLRDHLSPELQRELDELSARRSELALRRLEIRDPSHAGAIEALEREVERREADLSRSSAAFRAHSEPPTIASVQAALADDATLIEFVHYQRFDPHAGEHAWREPRYVAYVLQREGLPRFVELGEAAVIEAAVAAALSALSHPGRAVAAPLRALDELLCAPIRRLGVTDHVLISPDAALHLVPFAALVDEHERHLVDRWQITYLASGRDLARPDGDAAVRAPPLVIAAPDYGDRWGELPAAIPEAEALQRYFPDAELRLGADATKAALIAAAGPRFLHIATHGFSRVASIANVVAAARDAAPADAAAPLAMRSWRDDAAASAIPALPPSPDDHPDLEAALDDSGLLLAGRDDAASVLTARELAAIDLRGTRLVVLSACETGVGQVTRSEGVYGLRRAITIAGARTQVVSLWRVEDEATYRLMDLYYRMLRAGHGRAEALRRAQRELQSEPGYAHPFYWAAFVASGDEGPL